jgi:hypothetical protein
MKLDCRRAPHPYMDSWKCWRCKALKEKAEKEKAKAKEVKKK